MTVPVKTEPPGTALADGPLPAIGDWKSFESLRALQEERIGPVLRHARNSPFYATRLEPGQSLGTVGFTSKSDLRDSYPFGMLGVPKARLATYHESSGSTGNPTPAYFTEAEWTDLADRFVRKTVPIGPEDTLLVRIPYGLVLAGHMAHWAAMRSGATVIPGDCRSLAVPYSRVVRLLRDLDVTITWSTPSESLIWVAAAKAAGYDVSFPAMRALYVAGEPMSSARRHRIEEIWSAPVIEEYGCTEVGPLGSDCPEGRMHFWADRVLPEIYNPATGEVTAEGTGQLVITPLYREAMPLVRYNIEDLVDLRYEDCACGWKLPTVRVLGRLGQGYTVGGKRLGQIQVEEHVYRLPADFGVLFWRARAEQDRLVVQIEVPADGNGEKASASLAASVQDELGVRCAVSAVPEGTLVPGELLAQRLDAMKPRKLFGPDEDWEHAVVRG